MGNISSASNKLPSRLPSMPSIKLKKKKLSDSVYQVISKNILHGNLEQGQRLREVNVAKELSVSRTPVREAFRRLENERMLERNAAGAYLVTTWNKKRLRDLATVRSRLECLAAEIICKKLKPNDLDYLQSIINRMEKSYQREDYHILVSLDIEFHSYLWERTEHIILLDLLNSIKIQILYYMFLTLPGEKEEYAKMHQILLDALKQRNPEIANQAMLDHVIPPVEPAINKLDIK